MFRPRSVVPVALLVMTLGAVWAQEPAPPAPPAGQTPPAVAPPPAAPAPTPTPTPTPKPAPQQAAAPRMFWGGGVGMSFGDVDYISISPQIGWMLSPRLAAGFGVEYAHRNDNRYDQDLTTNDYGANAFARFTLTKKGLFAAVEYEYLRYEYYASLNNKVTDNYSSPFIGGGLARPMGPHSALILQAMYNLNWSENEFSPYDSAYVVTVGVSAGF